MILLTGATGYVGGRLLPLLSAEGRQIRCLSRHPEHLRWRESENVQVVAGDLLDPASLDSALVGVETAYYLVHSLNAREDFEDLDREAVRNFVAAARRAGVRRIVYLGGLGDDQSVLSAHLRSRQEIGEILRQSGIPTIEFRASIVIGSGSLSFELIRSLVERLPVMVCPRWVATPTQPIAIEDVLAYLVAALDWNGQDGTIVEIGGPEVVCYGDIMREYARQRGLRRFMIPVPVLTPRLSSLWLNLVTPVYAHVGRQLVEGLRNPTIVKNPAAQAAFAVRPRDLSQAIARSLVCEDQEFAQTRWSDALSALGPVKSWGGVRFGRRIIDSRTVSVPLPPRQAFAPIQRIGGDTGWYFTNWLWRIRGLMDQLVGGAGLRRGRRSPVSIRVGDVIDFWRVEAFEPDHLLRLRAEMRLPGRAWLEFEVSGDDDESTIRQTAIFDPLGIAGQLYWYTLYALHEVIFRGMLRSIARAAVTGASTQVASSDTSTGGEPR